LIKKPEIRALGENFAKINLISRRVPEIGPAHHEEFQHLSIRELRKSGCCVDQFSMHY